MSKMMKKISEKIRLFFKNSSDEPYFSLTVLSAVGIVLFFIWEVLIADMIIESYEPSLWNAAWLLYTYPLGFIITSYLAAVQLKNVNMYGEEKEEKKFRFIVGLAFTPFFNMSYLITFIIGCIVVCPLIFLIGSFIDFLEKIKDYILDGYRNALERISNEKL